MVEAVQQSEIERNRGTDRPSNPKISKIFRKAITGQPR
jgi:hypothetical protein